MKNLITISAVILTFVFNVANASPVTVINNGAIVVPMASLNLLTTGPIIQAPGITWSSPNPPNTPASFGVTNGYGFGSNGFWNGQPPMAGSGGGGLGAMEYHFDQAISAVGGLLNYAPGSGNAPTISIFDSNHALIESLVLNFSTGGRFNTGEFHGFSLDSPLISYFSLSGSFIGLRDLTIVGSPIVQTPIPSAVWLFCSALAGLFGVRRLENNEHFSK